MIVFGTPNDLFPASVPCKFTCEFTCEFTEPRFGKPPDIKRPCTLNLNITKYKNSYKKPRWGLMVRHLGHHLNDGYTYSGDPRSHTLYNIEVETEGHTQY